MKNLLTVVILPSFLMLCGFAAPCNAEILFSYDSGGGTSDISISGAIPGAGDTVTYLTDIFHTLTAAGLPSDNGTYAGLYLVETYCTTGSNECIFGEAPDVIYLTGDIAGLGISDNSFSNPILAITLSSPLTGTSTPGGTFILNIPTSVSSVYVDPIFLADFGFITTPPLTGLTGVFAGGGGGNYTTVVSASLNVDDAPEPGSWILMTLGASSIVFLARRKSSRAG